MPRIKEQDFVARHAFQRLATTDAPTPEIASADTNQDGAIEGDPELRAVYQKLLALDSTATTATGVDLDAAAVKPIYNALTARFAQKAGTEGALGTKRLVDVAELAAVRAGASVLERKPVVKQLGVGSIQDALLVLAAADTAQPSLLRVNLGTANAHRGLFGPGTEGAIKELQRQVGLPQTGKVDVDTLNALDARLSAARGAPVTPPVTPPAPVTSVTHARYASLPVFGEILAGRAVLKSGDQGPAVSAVQQALADMGFPMMVLKNDVGESGVDGAWGEQTSTALKNFQTHAKLPRSGVLDAATMAALLAKSPEPGKKAWDAGQPAHAPIAKWNGTTPLRIVTVKDEHRTFLFDATGTCTGIFPNAHGTAGSDTDTGLKKIRTKLDEAVTRATGEQLWQTPRAFGKRILDLSWASGAGSGEELHGTYDYKNMGKDVSHGCVRHYNEHIITMFDAVSVGDHVAIVASHGDPMLRA